MLKRMQGSKWHKEKDKYELIYTYKSERGNIKGVYQEIDGKKRVGHWMNNEEKEEYLRTMTHGHVIFTKNRQVK